MAISGKRVCITGGAGFIGSYLVQHLIEDNEVVVYDNLHRNAIQFAHVDGHPHLRLIKGDVMDYDAPDGPSRGARSSSTAPRSPASTPSTATRSPRWK